MVAIICKSSFQIPIKFLKEAGDVLAYPLIKKINVSIKVSVSPEECKITELKPLFKKDSQKIPKNISLLCVVSEINTLSVRRLS